MTKLLDLKPKYMGNTEVYCFDIFHDACNCTKELAIQYEQVVSVDSRSNFIDAHYSHSTQQRKIHPEEVQRKKRLGYSLDEIFEPEGSIPSWVFKYYWFVIKPESLEEAIDLALLEDDCLYNLSESDEEQMAYNMEMEEEQNTDWVKEAEHSNLTGFWREPK